MSIGADSVCASPSVLHGNKSAADKHVAKSGVAALKQKFKICPLAVVAHRPAAASTGAVMAAVAVSVTPCKAARAPAIGAVATVEAAAPAPPAMAAVASRGAS